MQHGEYCIEKFKPVTIFQLRIMTIGHIHWIWPVSRFLASPPYDIKILKTVDNLSKAKTCCSLLVEHRGEQEEGEGVVEGDKEEVVPVDDIVWWSITLLVHPSTCTETKYLLSFISPSVYLGECSCG